MIPEPAAAPFRVVLAGLVADWVRMVDVTVGLYADSRLARDRSKVWGFSRETAMSRLWSSAIFTASSRVKATRGPAEVGGRVVAVADWAGAPACAAACWSTASRMTSEPGKLMVCAATG